MKVSVIVVTYNHARYILEALSSVQRQRCAFDVEVLISEDCSTDSTRQIAEQWQSQYAGYSTVTASEHNLKSNYVVRRAFEEATGEYVALLDGDDFWTDDDKLSRQVAVLDADRSLSLCCANAAVVDADGRFTGKLWSSTDLAPRLGIGDLWQGNPFATCGTLFRRDAMREIPDWYDGFFPVTDWPLYLLAAQSGDIAYLARPMGAYRLHPGGLYSSKPDEGKLAAMDKLFHDLIVAFEGRYDAELRDGKYRYFADWTREYLASHRLALARSSFAYARGAQTKLLSRRGLEMASLWARLLQERWAGRAPAR